MHKNNMLHPHHAHTFKQFQLTKLKAKECSQASEFWVWFLNFFSIFKLTIVNFLRKSLFDWSITNTFGTWGTPQSRNLNCFHPQNKSTLCHVSICSIKHGGGRKRWGGCGVGRCYGGFSSKVSPLLRCGGPTAINNYLDMQTWYHNDLARLDPKIHGHPWTLVPHYLFGFSQLFCIWKKP